MNWDELYGDSPRISTANSLYKNVLHGRMRHIKDILKRGIDINAKNDFGENVLIAALKINDDSKRCKVFKFLLKKGADIHFKDEEHERNILCWACYLQRDTELDELLGDAAGELDIKEKDKHGTTALHYATQVNNINIVLKLVRLCNRFRESVDILDNQGFTPYILARRLGHREIANILQKEGHASRAQSDAFTFRSSREWSSYGRWERQRENQRELQRRLVLDRIRGDYKLGSSNDSIERNSNISLPLLHQSGKSKENNIYSKDDIDGLKRKRRSSIAAMSLLDMTSLERGHLVRSFRHSELDTSKMSEYKDILGDINSIFHILSQENSTSFRKTALEPPPAPKQIEPIVPEKAKVSSLAIIMGRKNRTLKSPRLKRNTPVKKTRKESKKSVRIESSTTVKKTNAVQTLPYIKLNNKVL